MTPRNPPAFPVQKWDVEKGCVVDASESGMTLRDYFAAKAMQGMYAGNVCSTNGDVGAYAQAAYSIADAMLAEREK